MRRSLSDPNYEVAVFLKYSINKDGTRHEIKFTQSRVSVRVAVHRAVTLMGQSPLSILYKVKKDVGASWSGIMRWPINLGYVRQPQLRAKGITVLPNPWRI